MMNTQQIVKKLTEIGKDLVKQLELNKNPHLEIPERSLNNVYFDKESGLIKLGDKKQRRYYLNMSQAKKFMQTLLVASKIKWLLEEDKPSLSIRQLYYLLKHTIPGSKENTFDTQDETDPIVEDVEVMLDVLRENLRLIATPNGVLAGNMIVEDKTGDVLDYTKMGSAGGAIPPIVEDEYFHIKEINVDYVLVIEKYAVWNVLNQQKFWKKNNCLIITGKGQPARAERRLIHRLAFEYTLPIYVFTDMDPWGYYIYSVYKQGSINLAFFSEKAGTPKSKFIGFQTKDVKQFDMPSSSFIKMKDVDYKRIKEMKKYQWFQNKEWQQELKALEKLGFKIEQDALVSKSIEFTAETYLPWKIENKDFLP